MHHYKLSLLLKTLLLMIFSVLLPSSAFNNLYISGNLISETSETIAPVLWIVRAGGQIQQIVLPAEGGGLAFGIASSENQVYIGGATYSDDLIEIENASLWIADLDGSNVQLITFPDADANFIYGVALENSKVYMAGIMTGDETSHGAYLLITNLDGTDLQQTTLSIASGSGASWVAVNASYAYVVGSDGTNTILWICNAGDGSLVNTITLQAEGEDPERVVLANNSLYITGGNNLKYYVTNLDGSNLQTITPGGTGPQGKFIGIAVNSKIYITVDDSGDNNPPKLLIANLAGTSFQYIPLASGVGLANDLTVGDSQVFTTGTIQTTPDSLDGYVWITGLDGSNVRQILLGENAVPFDIIGTIPPLSNPLWSAFQLYSPLKILRGVSP